MVTLAKEIMSNPFDQAAVPPPEGSKESLSDWDALRDSGLSARHLSALGGTQADRDEFLDGARALGLIGRAKTLKPQQVCLADVLNAGNKFTGVLMPRRSTKTTTILAWLIGRCLNREDYLCAYAVMTSQKKARDRFLKDVIPILERTYPDEDTRPFKIRTANGTERLVFNNGAILQFLGPAPDDFRSDAYDVIVLDESGEAEPEVGSEVLSAALPTMDTRPGAMIVLAGTAAKYRDGNLLWDELEAGRSGEARHGILDFSAPIESLDPDCTWEEVEPLVLRWHPGVGTLTTIEDIHDNFDRLTRDRFGREYLGLFGTAGQSAFINAAKWSAAAEEGALPALPKTFGLAFALHPDQTVASIGVAWRESGVACVGIIEHRPRIKWVGPTVGDVARKHRRPIAHDERGVAKLEAEQIARQTPRPKLLPQKWGNVANAASLFMRELDAGNLRHWDQAPLNNAVAIAVKRSTQSGPWWAFGRPTPEADITGLEAVSMALRVYDDLAGRSSLQVPEAMK